MSRIGDDFCTLIHLSGSRSSCLGAFVPAGSPVSRVSLFRRPEFCSAHYVQLAVLLNRSQSGPITALPTWSIMTCGQSIYDREQGQTCAHCWRKSSRPNAGWAGSARVALAGERCTAADLG